MALLAQRRRRVGEPDVVQVSDVSALQWPDSRIGGIVQVVARYWMCDASVLDSRIICEDLYQG